MAYSYSNISKKGDEIFFRNEINNCSTLTCCRMMLNSREKSSHQIHMYKLYQVITTPTPIDYGPILLLLL